MANTTFRRLREVAARDPLLQWYRELSTKGRAKLDRELQQLAQTPLTLWRRPKAVSLGHHVYVIHFKDENRTAHRPTGFYVASEKSLTDEDSFVITVPAIEKDDKYLPADYQQQTIDAKLRCEGKSIDDYSAKCWFV